MLRYVIHACHACTQPIQALMMKPQLSLLSRPLLYLAKQIPCAFPQQQLLAESSFPFFLLLVQTRDSAQFASIRTSDATVCRTCLLSLQ